ncbi:related to Putative ribonucleoside-diphosphate reductase small chain B [Armillaria ostoyae]|uniref:Related to Putative ribonucleoside-diphosphate reductase small chain B n=1 Tax=Armillaria ostoyae TaxID=47428 RepID=A0A284RVG9_ARMOS|nr:related to Putative ribonucleoside-diphosphate reductase small chain B [Armillaria ostoyae]
MSQPVQKPEILGEPLLDHGPEHFILFPLKDSVAFDFYKKAQASLWTAEEMDLMEDRLQWTNRLTPAERFMLTQVLAFFATADSIVGENLVQRFSAEVQIPEFRMFYDFQAMMENVHWEVYSLLITTLIPNEDEQSHLFHAISTVPCVRAKADWALRWITSDASFASRVVAFAAVEGIFFSGAFASIFWLKKKGLMPGLTFSNELISRDEGLHTDFACYMYSCLQHKLPDATLTEIVTEASELEQVFWKEDTLVDGILGLSAPSMVQYIKFVTDRLLAALNVSKVYNTENPFEFIEMISLEGKTNFFEHRVSDYAKAFITGKGPVDFGSETNAEF